MSVHNLSYKYDQDLGYGWVKIELSGDTETIIIEDGGKYYGFEYYDGEMTPVCVCSAWNESECACRNVDW